MSGVLWAATNGPKPSLKICPLSSWNVCIRNWSRKRQHWLIAALVNPWKCQVSYGAGGQGYHSTTRYNVPFNLLQGPYANRLRPLLFLGQPLSWEIIRKWGKLTASTDKLLYVQDTRFLLPGGTLLKCSGYRRGLCRRQTVCHFCCATFFLINKKGIKGVSCTFF